MSSEAVPGFSRAKRYGSISVLAVVNAIMLAGGARASDTATTPSSTDNTAKPATPAKKADATAATPASTTAKSTGKVPQMSTIVVTAPKEGTYQGSQASLPYYTEPLRDTPETITIIPQQVIKDQNATTLRDILRNVPGISFQAGEGSSTVAGDNLSIRGFNSRDDMFIDGIRDTGIYTRDPFNTEQVEVVKGPASAYEGYGETGGSVNLISKTPFLQPSYEVDGGYGTNNYNRESIDINQPITEFGDTGMAFRLNAFQQYNEVANRDFVYNGRWGFAPSLSFGLGTPTRITFSYLHQREDDLPDYGFPFINAAAVARGDFPVSQLNQAAPLPYSNWYGLYNRDQEKAITDMPTLTIEHDFDNGIKFVNQSRYDRTSFGAYNTSARFDTTPTLLPGEITRETSTRDDVDELIDNKTFTTIPFETFGIPNTLVTSLELSKETDNLRTGTGPNQQTSLNDPNPFQPYTGNITWADPTQNTLEDTAFSLFDTIKFLPELELTGGMRYDHLDARSYDPGAKTPHDFDEVNNLASWRLALVYKPVKFGSIYAGYGTSYNPSIQGIADGASNDTLATNTVNLAPEEDESYEIGTKWDVLDEKLSLNLALFRTNKTNARVVDPTLPGTVYELSGDQRVQGVEFDAAGSLTKDWKIFGGYVYMQSKVVSGPHSSFPGNELPNTPTQSASLWTTYDLPLNFTVGTGGVFVDQRYSAVNELNSSPGYWTQQAMAAYKVNKNVQVQINVSNLWDKHYIDLVGAHQVVPGAGRTVIFSTTIKF
jgi:catecholate siderophore receptor